MPNSKKTANKKKLPPKKKAKAGLEEDGLILGEIVVAENDAPEKPSDEVEIAKEKEASEVEKDKKEKEEESDEAMEDDEEEGMDDES